MVYTQDNNSKGKLYIRSCEHLSQLNWFQCVGVPKCSNANFTFSNLCITPSWTAIVWSYTLQFIFFPLFIYYFCLNSDTFFVVGYSVYSMLDSLFYVEFAVSCSIFFCFSNSIIYWLSVRLCTLYIYDDMALVITITIVRERIGNSVLFLYVTVLSPYSNLHTIF